MSIKIFYDEVNFRLKGSGKFKKFLEKVILEENRIPGDLNFIFTNDVFMVEINTKFLNHDYNTDVIAFDYSAGNKLSGEVYISIDSVKSNAVIYNVRADEEVLRVMIHGTLHLCGYRDDNEKQWEEMREIQERRLDELRRII